MPHYNGFEKLNRKLKRMGMPPGEMAGDEYGNDEAKKKKFRRLLAAKKKGKYYDQGGDTTGSYGG